MRTEDDLRAAFAALADTAPSPADMLPPLSRAERGKPRRRRTAPVLATAAAVAAIGVAVPLAVVRTHPQPSASPPARQPGCSMAAADFVFFRVDPVPGADLGGSRGVSCLSRGAYLYNATGGLLGALQVWRPGVFDPTEVRRGRPAAIAGHRGYIGTYTVPAGQPPLGRPVPWTGAVAWEYAPDAWATISAELAHPLSLPLALKVAAAVHAEDPAPLRVPLRLSYLPAGLAPTNIGASPPDMNTTFGAAADFGFTRNANGGCGDPQRCGPPLEVVAQYTGETSLRGAPGRQIRIGGHGGRLVPVVTPDRAGRDHPAPGIPPQVWVQVGHWRITVSVNVNATDLGLTTDDLIRIAAGATPAASQTDRSTWFDARAALP
ncbi:MAG: hypothetical protein V7637_4193 [Mycobacteriales bacterium]|jgi:hypothetical protein